MRLSGFNLVLIREAHNRLNSILALFSSGLESSTGSRVTDITLEGQDPALPRAAKMTLIVLRGGLEEASLRGFELVYSA